MNTHKDIGSVQSIFPFKYLLDFMRFLKSTDRFNIVTYDDFDWQYDLDSKEIYKREFRIWTRAKKESEDLSNKISVLLQFDVDGLPQITSRIVREMMKLDVPANIMLFTQRINRKLFADSGILEGTDYPIDDELFLKAQSNGFVIGYHTNAVERAGHDLNKAVGIFRQDLDDMRRRFPGLRFFSPHGGVRSASGLNNNDLPFNEVVNEELGTFWVHNRHAPSFAGGFSDGGSVLRANDPNRINLRASVKQWRIGNRYRVLLHPQFYGGDAPTLRPEIQRLMEQENHKENLGCLFQGLCFTARSFVRVRPFSKRQYLELLVFTGIQ